jgi:hypothetical protein
MKKTKEEIATKAKNLADALAGEPTLVGRTLRELALMIVDLATQPDPDKTASRRRK